MLETVEEPKKSHSTRRQKGHKRAKVAFLCAGVGD
jgi:hypothetical protein